MLIRFTVENFLSFKSKQSLSMIPGQESLKSHHKTNAVKGVAALKMGIVLGANASGKSNLIKAMDFGRKKVLWGTKPEQLITSDFFKLDKKTLSGPSYFEYEIQYRGKNYAYGFVLSAKEILDEWLCEIGRNGDIPIFERKNTTEFNTSFLVGKKAKAEERHFVEFLAKSTPRNQLFLTHIRNNNVVDNISNIADVINVLDWFKDVLTVIYPATKEVSSKTELLTDSELKSSFERILKYFDTGVDGIEFEAVSLEKLGIPDELRDMIRTDLLNSSSKKSGSVIVDPEGDKYYFISLDKDNELTAQLLKTRHVRADGSKVLFDFEDESDGTKRIIDLIPFILDYTNSEKVFLIDEIDRSLHPNVVKTLFEYISETCEDAKSQVIASTHQAILLTQKIFRRDEIWFLEKNKYNYSTELYSLEDYKIRFDKEIMKDYLLGRYRGTPNIGNISDLRFSQN